MMRARNETRNQVLAENLEPATTILQRMIGLLGRRELPDGHGLWLKPCSSIHTFFMRFAIDVIFASEENRVVRTYAALPPFRITPWIPGARSVLELPAGTLSSRPAHVGDQLVIEPQS
jgi:uncharacterized protein